MPWQVKRVWLTKPVIFINNNDSNNDHTQRYLKMIYELLIDSGRMNIYNGDWTKKSIPPFNGRLDYREMVRLPVDMEKFTSIVLAGALNYLEGKMRDIIKIKQMLSDIRNGTIELLSGRFSFPTPTNPGFVPHQEIEEDKAHLRDWMKKAWRNEYGVVRDCPEDEDLYSAVLHLAPELKRQYLGYVADLTALWPEDLPWFTGDNDNETFERHLVFTDRVVTDQPQVEDEGEDERTAAKPIASQSIVLRYRMNQGRNPSPRGLHVANGHGDHEDGMRIEDSPGIQHQNA